MAETSTHVFGADSEDYESQSVFVYNPGAMQTVTTVCRNGIRVVMSPRVGKASFAMFSDVSDLTMIVGFESDLETAIEQSKAIIHDGPRLFVKFSQALHANESWPICAEAISQYLADGQSDSFHYMPAPIKPPQVVRIHVPDSNLGESARFPLESGVIIFTGEPRYCRYSLESAPPDDLVHVGSLDWPPGEPPKQLDSYYRVDVPHFFWNQHIYGNHPSFAQKHAMQSILEHAQGIVGDRYHWVFFPARQPTPSVEALPNGQVVPEHTTRMATDEPPCHQPSSAELSEPTLSETQQHNIRLLQLVTQAITDHQAAHPSTSPAQTQEYLQVWDAFSLLASFLLSAGHRGTSAQTPSSAQQDS